MNPLAPVTNARIAAEKPHAMAAGARNPYAPANLPAHIRHRRRAEAGMNASGQRTDKSRQRWPPVRWPLVRWLLVRWLLARCVLMRESIRV